MVSESLKVDKQPHRLIDPMCGVVGHGGGWGYSAHSVEAIRFCADADILLGGLGLFGGRGEYTAKIKVSPPIPLFFFFLNKDLCTI